MFGRKKGNKLTEAEKAERDERKSKFEQTRDKFKLGPHHKMERFGVVTLVFSLCMSLVLGGAFLTFREKTKENLGNKVVYTSEFESSITSTMGEVVDVYRNEDGTKAYVLLKLEDAEETTLNANDYKVFISAFQDHLDKEPKGVFQVIGSTGYLGIELISNSGFANQVMDIWVRIGTDISGAKTEESDLYKIDKSFSDNDQFRILINPGATAVKYNEILDDNKATISDIYKHLVAVDEEKKLKEELQTSVNEMAIEFNKAEEYSRRLNDLNVRTPKLPDMMAGDKFTPILDKNGDETKNSEFIPAKVYKNGLDLKWRELSLVKDGYFSSITAPGTNKEDYYSKLVSGGTEYDITDVDTMEDENWVWAYNNGKEIASDSSVQIDKDKTALEYITAYETAVDNYIELKRKYQTDQQYALLLLEINSDNINLNSQVLADNENNIVVWQQRK